MPKGKARTDRATTPAMPSSKRTFALAAILLLLAAVAALFWFAGNPLDLLRVGELPSVGRRPVSQLPVAATALPEPAGLPTATPIPPPLPGSFSIVIGTYDNARQAQLAEVQLRSLKLEPYAIDILLAPDDLQRRLLLGRFATREEAEAVIARLGLAFSTARVIPGAQERLRVLIP